MKTIVVRTAICILVITTLFSCAKEKKTPVESTRITENSTVGDVDLNITDSKSEVVFTDETINSIYQQYLDIKGALVNTDQAKAKVAAKQLETIIVENEENKQLKATAKLIALTKDIQKQRDFFVTLTAEIEKLVSNATITSGEVYKQFCPMAFDGKGGYWLSDSKEVRNPFYGDKMLKCGRVEETIK